MDRAVTQTLGRPFQTLGQVFQMLGQAFQTLGQAFDFLLKPQKLGLVFGKLG